MEDISQKFSAPTARNAKAWAIGPGLSATQKSRALKARNGEEDTNATVVQAGVAISRLQRSSNLSGSSLRALPWAFTFRAVGAGNMKAGPSTEVLGYYQSSVSRTLNAGLRVLFTVIALGSVCFSQTNPAALKVEPPSWWAGSSVNPVRLLIRGRNLKGAEVQAVGAGWRVVGQPKVNEQGTYLFVDVAISPRAKPGPRQLLITTREKASSVSMREASFEILPPLARAGRFQGFSPADVMYLIMIDRFSDGDTTNNDPSQSRGIYDRKNKFYYHGGDLQGVIDRLPYLQGLGVTAIWLTPWYDNYDRPNEIELKEGKPSTGFHGYNPQDFYAVEEHFGSLAKLRELVDAAHRSGIKIIQDEVVNHTGPYHPWVDDPPTPTWFNGTKTNHLKNVFQTWVLHDPRPVENLKRETMEGWFLDFLPDLNQHDPEVSRYLIQNTLWWIGTTGLDGIRMDTWQYVPNSFWRDWNAALKREFPNFTVVGEVKDGEVVHTSFFQGGRVRFDGVDSGLDSLLDFPLFYPIRQAFAEGHHLDEIPKTLGEGLSLQQLRDFGDAAGRSRRWPLHERKRRDDRRTEAGECVSADDPRRAAALLRRRDCNDRR